MDREEQLQGDIMPTAPAPSRTYVKSRVSFYFSLQGEIASLQGNFEEGLNDIFSECKHVTITKAKFPQFPRVFHTMAGFGECGVANKLELTA